MVPGMILAVVPRGHVGRTEAQQLSKESAWTGNSFLRLFLRVHRLLFLVLRVLWHTFVQALQE